MERFCREEVAETEAGDKQRKKKKTLLKCYIKGDEMQELGPSFEGDGP